MSAIEVKESGSDIKLDDITDKSSSIKVIEIDGDLEDGEIDDDEEDNNNDDDVVVVTHDLTKQQKNEQKPLPQISKLEHHHNQQQQQQQQQSPLLPIVIDTIDLIKDGTSPIASPRSSAAAGTSTASTNKTKSKKSQPFEDDHAISIENALANVLKKQGIQPTWPKLEQRHIDDVNKEAGHGQSRSSRRRKRKKEQDMKEKERERKDKKKHRYDSPERHTSPPLATANGPPPFDDENELDDDYEMLNVRGGSPPPNPHPITAAQMPPPPMHGNYNDGYDSESQGSSYDSYDDSEDKSNEEENRRKRRRDKKSSRNKRERRNDKRNRRESEEDKRSEPTKMELCKFYLLECCAKGNNCSYMHAEFPCKYYYLGLDCVQKEDCKFLHGKPLNEQLRHILLKHLETAPKEILGNFKRIGRESALQQMSKQHEKLCRQYNEQNTWPPLSQLLAQYSRRGGGGGGDRNHINSDIAIFQNQQQSKQNPTNTSAVVSGAAVTAASASSTSEIPSLLDMVITPPTDQADLLTTSHKSEKQRKSRWADNQHSNSTNSTSASKRPEIEPVSNAPSYLDLKNLTGVISAEHIEKLSELGITNLDQVNQLTFGQLNQIGLTIAEISEIQLNARNMEKLGINTGSNKLQDTTTTKTLKQQDPKTNDTTSTRDVDMRADTSPGVSSTTIDDKTSTTNASLSSSGVDKDAILCSNSNSNSSNAVVTVNLSQYVKEADLSFDRGDMYDDENDDEQLVIDDGNMEKEEIPPVQKTPEINEKKSNGDFESLNFMKLSSDIGSTLKNPFKSLYSFGGGDKSDAFSFSFSEKKLRSPFQAYADSDSQSDHETNELEIERNSEAATTARRSSPTLSRKKERSRSRSRSPTPTRSRSTTPEASPSSHDGDACSRLTERTTSGETKKSVTYERSSMYDFNAAQAEVDAKNLDNAKNGSTGDIDLRLPFQPITSYIPATEIDGSITSHLPLTYKVYEVEIQPPNYSQLRNNFKSDQTTDPRMRRILGLPELSQSKTSAALKRSVRKASITIASPESDGASPKYYTPPSSITASESPRSSSSSKHLANSSSTSSSSANNSSAMQPRLDPRSRGSTDPRSGSSDPRSGSSDPRSGSSDPRSGSSDPRSGSSDPRSGSSDPRRASSDPRRATTTNSSGTLSTSSNNSNSSTSTTSTTPTAPVVEIRNLLQKSEWYKNLNSKFKIMVNQQLALVSTELKKFHQDTSPNKIFDMSFIVNNSTLQQILTNLGIYIDDNGEVAHVDGDQDDAVNGNQATNNAATSNSSIQLPNLSQPPPNQQQQQRNLDFLRAPPPNMLPPALVNNPNAANVLPPQLLRGIGPPPPAAPAVGLNPFSANVQNTRPSLLGLPPGVVNPFLGLNPNFVGAGGPVAAVAGLLNNAFNNFGNVQQQQQQQQRNFIQNKNRNGNGGNNRRSKKL